MIGLSDHVAFVIVSEGASEIDVLHFCELW